jgi:ribosome maturation factor RimP
MVDRISGLIEEKIHQLHADLVEVEYRREDGDRFLRIYIDHNDGVSLDLCSSISRVVKEIIDTAEIDYDHLEVSSPGIDRKLKTDQDFLRFQGNKVKVKLSRNYTGPRQVIGF